MQPRRFQIIDRQHDGPADRRRRRRKHFGVVPARHQFYQRRLRRLSGRKVRAAFAVSENRDAVGNRENLVEPVRDIDDPAFSALQFLDDAKQSPRFFARQRGRRFVHHENPRRGRLVLEKGRGDLHQHSVAHRERREPRCRRDVADPERGKTFARPGVERAPIDKAETAWIGAAEKDVLRDAQRRNDVQFLVDEAQASPVRFSGRAQPDRAPGEPDFPAVGSDRAGEYLDERTLACAILAHQSQRFAGAQFERRILQRDRAVIGLAQMGYREEGHRDAVVGPLGQRRPARLRRLSRNQRSVGRPGRARNDRARYGFTFSTVMSFVGT